MNPIVEKITALADEYASAAWHHLSPDESKKRHEALRAAIEAALGQGDQLASGFGPKLIPQVSGFDAPQPQREADPCPGCRPGGVCRTPNCGSA
jgi:hypothetical protein